MCFTSYVTELKFDAKIDKNTNSKQIFFHFFSFYLKHRAKNCLNMK